jgi:hypothetical protein
VYVYIEDELDVRVKFGLDFSGQRCPVRGKKKGLCIDGVGRAPGVGVVFSTRGKGASEAGLRAGLEVTSLERDNSSYG